MEYQHHWNLVIQGQCEATKINISNFRIIPKSVFAGTLGTKNQELNDQTRKSGHHQSER